MATDRKTDGFAPQEYGSDVIVDTLRGLAIEYIAMNPGATFRGIHDSLVNHLGNERPELILCNHEEIAVAVAQGYGRAAGKPMAAFVHDIVGLLHASMAMFNASWRECMKMTRSRHRSRRWIGHGSERRNLSRRVITPNCSTRA